MPPRDDSLGVSPADRQKYGLGKGVTTANFLVAPGGGRDDVECVCVESTSLSVAFKHWREAPPLNDSPGRSPADCQK